MSQNLARSSSLALRVIEFVDEILTGSPAKRQENVTILGTYMSMISCLVYLWHVHSDQDFSYMLTIGGAAQAFAFFLMVHKMKTCKSSAGVSSKTLQMYFLVLIFRLTSTLVKNGYLPVDATGDWAYQMFDLLSLALVFQALFLIHKRYADTYQDHHDTLPIWNAVLPLAGLAGVLHGDLNHNWFFDTVWTFSMYLDVVAMLPQLYMLVHKGGEVEALTSHYVALLFLNRCLNFFFWYTGVDELAPHDGGFNKVGWLLCVCHGLSVLFSADFMYHYFQWGTRVRGAKGEAASGPMVLPVGVATDV